MGRAILIASTLLLLAGQVFAQETVKTSPSAALTKEKVDKGWFWYEDPVQIKKRLEEVQPDKKKKPPLKKDDPCAKMETWKAECGFVDPGKSFEFQEKQRDALLERMTMAPNEPKAVENFQYYMKWVSERAVEIANIWQYNMAQNPALDPGVKAPISTFGLKLMTEVQDAGSKEIFGLIKKEGALIYFTRTDCQFCHVMANSVLRIGEQTGVEVWNASLDSQCLAGFVNKCRTQEVATAPAQALQVSTVPTLFLFIEPSTWIRVATGVTDEETIKARIVSFFSAYRNAMIKGIAPDGNRAPVDFSYDHPTGVAPGISDVELPTTQDIEHLVGKR